jgi:branched-chain amino acid aminotransferase
MVEVADMGFFVSVNGVITPAEQARVSVLDNGFTFGDAVYETLRTYRGRPFHLGRHLQRLRESADRLGIALPIPDAELEQRLGALLTAAGNPESYIRLMVTRGVGEISYRFDRIQGPTIVMVAKPYEPLPADRYEHGVPVIVSSVRRNHPLALDPAIKSCNLLNNILAVREAQARGAFEPIMLNDAGEVAEGAGSNIFIVKDGVVITPPLEAGILAGVTRAVVLEIGPAQGIRMREEALSVRDLLGADEAFLTSTLKEVVPIATVDGVAVGRGRGWVVTRKLLEAYRAYAILNAATGNKDGGRERPRPPLDSP